MTLFAVEGAAGCGKTFRLMQALEQQLTASPLQEGQRVLAITFMHGARRRLHDKLHGVPGLRRRFECVTVDSFAWGLLRRWRSAASATGIAIPAEEDFDGQCAAAASLLQLREIVKWVAQSFPFVVVDEAQDLTSERLKIIQTLAGYAHVLLAADEFQCLDGRLRPNPLATWLQAEPIQPERLVQVRRTNIVDLLNAASALRAGQAPVSAKSFKILGSTGTPMAASFLANAIAWNVKNSKSIAIITPSRAGTFATNVVARVCDQPCGKQRNGPFTIRWDRSDDEEATRLLQGFELVDGASLSDALQALDRLQQSVPIRNAASWLRLQARAAGVTTFVRTDVERVIRSQIQSHRQRFGVGDARFMAMTVHQAKNREFDGVVVLWPYQVGGTPDDKRRLLYNAVTRAKRWCTVIAQSKQLLQSPPFTV